MNTRTFAPLDTSHQPLDEWRLRFPVTTTNRRVVESLTAVSDGHFGTRGLLRRRDGGTGAVTVASGVFDTSEPPDLLAGPTWTAADLALGDVVSEVAELDLSRGVLLTELVTDEATVRSAAFASIARPGVHVLEINGPVGAVKPNTALVRPDSPSPTAGDALGPDVMTTISGRSSIAAAAVSSVEDRDGGRTLHRIVGLASGDPASVEVGQHATHLAAEGAAIGTDELLQEHERAWVERWSHAAVDINGDTALQTALRFAQFHLLSSAPTVGEAAIGARGTTGPAYRGHVFWDTDVFVVPALAAMAPRLARAALWYRWNRLDAARARARGQGRRGARYPWESAATGIEATPRQGRDLSGNIVPILTGDQEEHIVADVAWAVDNYVNWTGDEGFLRDGGATILVETARYWHSRVERDPDGSGHIRGVIGPDEYHEDVDDNAYTNMMAAWNLRRSAAVCERLHLADTDESRRWRQLADTIVDGYHPDLGLHEQHAGFFELEPLLAHSVGQPPVSADSLLGRERTRQAQIIKQADVVMLHHLIPDQLPPESLQPDLDFYLPRTAHGSSLSPAITAGVLARAGRLDEALIWFEMAARFDLDNLSGTTAGGLHLATMGGLWQALTMGFLGIRPMAHHLEITPCVPAAWGLVTDRFRYRGAQVHVKASRSAFEVISSSPVRLAIGADIVRAEHITAGRTNDGWELQ